MGHSSKSAPLFASTLTLASARHIRRTGRDRLRGARSGSLGRPIGHRLSSSLGKHIRIRTPVTSAHRVFILWFWLSSYTTDGAPAFSRHVGQFLLRPLSDASESRVRQNDRTTQRHLASLPSADLGTSGPLSLRRRLWPVQQVPKYPFSVSQSVIYSPVLAAGMSRE
jgi:hypothetical protein